jgi:ribosome biogenesis protein YTM1
VLEEAAAAAAAGEDAAAASSRKKRRVAAENGSVVGVASAPLSLEAVASLPGHVHCVAAVAWPQPESLFSGGWDHSVRRFDVESRTNTDTYNGSKAVYAVAAPADGGSSSVVAFGGSDRVLRVWDARGVSGEGLAVKAYAAHEGWISSLAWRPGSSYHLISGGHDGAVKMWDIRTAVPLGTLQQHKEDAKVLCVGWWGSETLVSGGSDCKVQLYSLPA